MSEALEPHVASDLVAMADLAEVVAEAAPSPSIAVTGARQYVVDASEAGHPQVLFAVARFVRRSSMLKTIVSGLVLAVLSTPAFAMQYWVMKDPATQKCIVVQQQPATPAIRQAFQSRKDAEASIARSVACGGVD